MDVQADFFSIALLGARLGIFGLIIFGLIYFLIKMSMDTTTTAASKASFIKTLYLYLVSFVALMMLVICAVDLLSLGLKTYIFTKADQYTYYNPTVCPLPNAGETPEAACKRSQIDEEERKKSEEENRVAQKQRDAVRDISMLVVGLPLFIFHWRLARRKV